MKKNDLNERNRVGFTSSLTRHTSERMELE